MLAHPIHKTKETVPFSTIAVLRSGAPPAVYHSSVCQAFKAPSVRYQREMMMRRPSMRYHREVFHLGD
jgi:hypothetical protein